MNGQPGRKNVYCDLPSPKVFFAGMKDAHITVSGAEIIVRDMIAKTIFSIPLFAAMCLLASDVPATHSHRPADTISVKRYLYVAVPGIRDYLGYGGHGILVFDIDHDHRFVKRIPTTGFHPDGTPSNVKE
jgi:hypothetical protein